MNDQTRHYVILWLSICSAMIFAMVLLGGAVRLTGSGLSMVDWKPIMGVLPPLSELSWQQAFLQYQNFPEFQLVNSHITLSGFKFIYIMEYAHRLLGRLIGLVYFVPFLWLLSRKTLPSKLKPHLWGLFLMGGLQGVIGWYMVKSGLVDDPRVSQYRLTLHLMVAVCIYGYMLRIIAGLLSHGHPDQPSPGDGLGVFVIALILLMITTGGFVAGTHAGFIFNTFPTMGGQWLPDQLFSMLPLWLNFLENPITIQFIHRGLAIGVLGFVLYYGGMTFLQVNSPIKRKVCILMILAVILQVCLGIVTLLAKVPVYLGVAHQAGALLLLGAAVFAVFLEKPFYGINYAVDKV